MKKIFMVFVLSLLFLFGLLLNTSLTQVSTPPLSTEEAEVIKPIKKLAEAWFKMDIELYMSAYHEKAIIVTASGAKIDKKGLKKILASGMGGIHMSFNVEKIEITGDKATIECMMKWGNKDIPRKIDLIKEGEVWLVIGYWLR
jgi:hypothetical protein